MCGLFNMLSVVQTIVSDNRMINEFKRIWEEVVRPNIRYIPAFAWRH
jgi:hypothetical protein